MLVSSGTDSRLQRLRYREQRFLEAVQFSIRRGEERGEETYFVWPTSTSRHPTSPMAQTLMHCCSLGCRHDAGAEEDSLRRTRMDGSDGLLPDLDLL
jgi:hypothetical protein